VRSVKTLRGGLQEIAESIGVRMSCRTLETSSSPAQVQRIGPQHQAGSDSLLTAAVFFRIRSTYFNNELDDNYYA
jgi:CCR4-NOT transcription complex subunit 7/8